MNFDFRFWIESQENGPMNEFPSKSLSDNRKSAIQNPKWLALSMIAFVLMVTGAVAHAQHPGKISWIGYLAGAGSGPSPAFIQGLRDLGYIEGKNIGFVYRTAEGNPERYADLVAELVRLQVDVLVTDVTSAALALKKATNTIPIVMTSSTDPVGTGLVASLARPGGNVTGLTNVGSELGGKLLELLKEIAPGLSRAAILGTPGTVDEVFAKEMEVPARALGVQLIRLGLQSPDDVDGAFRTITKERANGLVMRLQPSIYSAHYKRVAELTASSRLPSISLNKSWVDAGGLMSYGADLNFQYRRAATYVDKILKGTKPADLPIEAPTKFELVINLKTAKQIGVTIPPNVLARADKVIK
jgi:putative tryptophan/tyrosine transport system substrate-binding protein